MAVVLFSGGCDSTLVLYNLAMQISKKEKEHQDITALSINHDQIPCGIRLRSTREKIKEEFKKRELTNYISFTEISITQSAGSYIEGPCGLTHPLIWLPTAALYCRQQRDSLYLGYHKGDDYWMYKYEAETAIQNFLKIMDKTNVTIEYPLRDTLKAGIIRELKDRGLYDLCWYCEAANTTLESVPCGTCYPCRTHKTALLQIEKDLDKDTSNNPFVSPLISTNDSMKKDCIKAVEVTGS